MSLPYPVFPGFKPGQTFSPLQTPVRSPQWNFKETYRYNNFKQQSVGGIIRTTKYWPNPLRLFEWRYGYLYDDPSGNGYNLGLNRFYPKPVPATDYQMLNAFWNAMQGTGNRFLLQPSDWIVGQTLTITSVVGLNNEFTISFSGTPAPISPGLWGVFTTLTTATFLNGQSLEILYTGPNSITVQFTHANYPLASETGTLTIGQLLTVDASNNAELVHHIGSYPVLPLSGAGFPASVEVTESVQVIDAANPAVLAGASAPPSFTTEAANTISGYPGIVLSFSSTPTAPVIAGFNYYLPCRFSEDTQEYENFLACLWLASKVTFEQDVIA